MSTPAAEKKETVILQTSDEEQFTVDKKVAGRSAMIKVMLDGEHLRRAVRSIPLFTDIPTSCASGTGGSRRVTRSGCPHISHQSPTSGDAA